MRYQKIVLDDAKIEKGIREGKLIPFSKILNEMKNDPKEWAGYLRIAKEFDEENERLLLARKIKNARLKSKMTQEQLARKLKTKKSYISLIESGKQNISHDYLEKVVKAMGRRIEIVIY